MRLLIKEEDILLSVTCNDQLKILIELATRIKRCSKDTTKVAQVKEFENAANMLAEEVFRLLGDPRK